MTDYGGVLNELVNGTWVEPDTGKRYDIGIQSLAIRDTLDGEEAALVEMLHSGKKLCVVSDPNTHDAIGHRIFKALKTGGLDVKEFVWKTPQCSDVGVEQIRNATSDFEVSIAVGSGTVSDTVKYASYLDEKPYSVFPTSPMTAYTTATASVSFDRFKKSITCRGAKGIFFDLSVLANCPAKLISAAFADVICRTTAQVDWLMSHLLLGTSYTETPYTLLAYDERPMIDNASRIASGDLDALAMLTRISALMGLGTRFSDTTHSGSMAEHQISHYIDMFAGQKHPGSSHGEQVGVATITMSTMQNRILNCDSPPLMKPTQIPERELLDRFGKEMGSNMIHESRRKALSQSKADELNVRFENEWSALSKRLQEVMLPFEQLKDAMKNAGCTLTATELGLEDRFYRDAVTYARYIRNRFSMLDIVDDSTGLDDFVTNMPI